MKQFIIMLFFISSLFAKEITLTSSDGFKLHAWLDKPTNTQKSAPIILFAHQFGADHTIWSDLAKKFNQKGYVTLNVDLRGHGKSILQNGQKNSVITDVGLDHIREALKQSNKKVVFKNIPSDLMLWLEHLSEDDTIDMDRLYLFGSSLGGGGIIPLLSEYEAKGLVAISSGRLAELSEETDMALSMSMTKQLYIAAKNDPLGAAQRSLDYAKKAILGTAIIISGDGHGTVLLPQVEEYIFTFMQQIK